MTGIKFTDLLYIYLGHRHLYDYDYDMMITEHVHIWACCVTQSHGRLRWQASLKLSREVHLCSSVLAMKLCTLGCCVSRNELMLICVAAFSDWMAAHSNFRLSSRWDESTRAPDIAMSYRSSGFHASSSSLSFPPSPSPSSSMFMTWGSCKGDTLIYYYLTNRLLTVTD